MRHLRVLFAIAAVLLAAPGTGFSAELRFCLTADPKTFHPLMVEDAPSETIRYLTGGVLIRLNRNTHELQPELALSWKIDAGARRITFLLRRGVTFSDGTPFSAEDVAYTFRTLMDPNLHSSTGDAFRSGPGAVETEVLASDKVRITFPAPIAALDRLFDQVPMLSARSPLKEKAVLGPFVVGEYKPGAELVLKRNPRYWKKDGAGVQLPYLDSLRLYIQQNRDLELVRFRRGELDLIQSLSPEAFEQLHQQVPAAARDLGPSLDSEMMWFNQVAKAPLPEYKKAWFRSRNFRRAISAAIHRDDLARVVYLGHARPSEGAVSAANLFWFNQALAAQRASAAAALDLLAKDGFAMRDGALRDREGHLVEFSLATNAGNKPRERMSAMIQQDLKALGVKLNLAPLDFGSLVERISRSFQYEACLLGFTNVDLDPGGQMNVWLSSAANHAWNPGQPAPQTAWEAEIDRLMRAQVAIADRNRRKTYFDKVQQIVSDESPIIYLVTKNALAAVSPRLRGVAPSALRPQVIWNIENVDVLEQISRNAN